MACGFGYISINMFIASSKASELEQKYQYRRSAIGTLALTIMGFCYAWYFSHPRPMEQPPIIEATPTTKPS